MKILTRYLTKTLVSSTLLVVFVLFALDVFMSLALEFRDVGQGDYGVIQAIIYVLLKFPNELYIFFPMAGLLGSLIGLGQLATNSELIVMRAVGVSLGQIIKIVLQVALVMLLVMVFVGEWLAPLALHLAESRKTNESSSGHAFITQQGTWIREGNNYVQIGGLMPGHELKNVIRYEFNDNRQLTTVSYAKRGVYRDGKWQMYHVAQSHLRTNTVSSEKLADSLWDMNLKPTWIGSLGDDAAEISLGRLYSYIQYLQANGLSAVSYKLALWKRVLQPLSTVVMIFLAVPFVFGSLRNATMGLRILIGLVLGFSFYILNQFFGPISLVYQIPPFWAAFSPTLLFTGIAFILMRWAR